MSLATDLRTAAVTAAANAMAPLLHGPEHPDDLAREAIEAARPFLEDALRVELVLTTREREDCPKQPPQLRAQHLWQQANGDEHRYLDAMIEERLLALVTVTRFVSAEDDVAATRRHPGQTRADASWLLPRGCVSS